MKSKIFLLISFSFVSLFIFSQQNAVSGYNIDGLVVDSLLSEPVEMATIGLYLLKDSSFIQGTASDEKGYFFLKGVKPSSYYLSISYIGYKTRIINIAEKRFSDGTIKLGNINLPTSDIRLSSVVVTAELPELVVKEDTLEYNAAAFRLTESAVVEDLLKRLPGVEVDTEGNISTSTGKEVKRVFVDGKEFFGNDPKMATRNLTADMVDKVQVVEKKSDLAILTGVEDDDPETIINITIKKGMKKGWMGNVNGGIGGLVDNKNDESARYVTGANVNRFTEQDQFSFVANANNINVRSSTDRGNTVRGSRGSGGAGNGITSSNTFGVNMSSIINDKLKFGGNVAYNYSDNYTNNRGFTQNLFENDSVTYQRSSSSDRNFSNNVSFDGKLEFRPDSSTTMIFTPSLSFNSSSSRTFENYRTVQDDPDSTLINRSESYNTLKSEGFQMRMQFDISRKLSATGRRLSFSGWFNLNNSNGDGSILSNTEKYNRRGVLTQDEQLNQQSNTKGNRNAYNMRLTYVEPVGKGRFLNFSYNVQVNNTENQRRTYDYDSLEYSYSQLNPTHSRSSDTRSVSQNIRANFNSNQTKYSYNVGISVSPVYNKSKSYVMDWFGEGLDSITFDAGRHAINYSPFLDFTYRFSADRIIRRNLRLRYNGRTTQPSVTQLDPNPNYTNILNIRVGNPDLLPSFNNNISLQLNNSNRETQRSLTAMLSHTFIQNQIINYTTWDDNGGKTTMPINQNGSWNSSANVLISLPLDNKKKLKFTTRSNIRYENEVGYYNVSKQSLKNITKTLDLSQNVTLSYSNDWYYGQLRGAMRYSHTGYSLDGVAGRESYNYSVTYSTQLTLPLSFTVASDVTYTGNSGLTSGYNKNEVLWNAEISKQFLKQKRGSLRLQITDILQQRLNIRRTVRNNSIQDNEFTALSSYVIFSFAYRFNNVGGGNRRNSRRSADSGGESFDGGEFRSTDDSSGGRGMGGRNRGEF